MQLNDPEIREALVQKLKNQSIKPKAIIEELRVHNGNAIADVVALYKDAHCYEIKGCNDKIERIEKQGFYYNQSFRKVTLVTTENHVKKAQSIAPKHWGIMLASNQKKNTSLRYVRKATFNPDFCKELAALILWKSEMLSLVKDDRLKRKPRDFLAHLISRTQKKQELSSNISDLLLSRQITHPAEP